MLNNLYHKMSVEHETPGTLSPLIIIVSGAPGSGKTTLAKQLAEHMRLLHIPRDDFFFSMNYTAREYIDRRYVGIPAYYDTLVYLAGRGVSLVTDGTIYQGISEVDINTRLAPVARLVNVHCRAENEHERFYAREVQRNGGKSAWLDNHMEHLKKIYSQAVDPLDLQCQLIEVDATKDYKPSLADIAAQIGDRNKSLEGNVYVGKKSD
jgi:chloramphenicol 3-O-phosphotransferase